MKFPAELLELLTSRPDDVAGYVVAGDWLTSQGHPWGEFIATQCRLQLETDPSQFLTLRRRGEALLAEHGRRWLGVPDAKVEWKWGFVERLSLKETSELDAVVASDAGPLARRLELWGGPESLRVALGKLGGFVRLEGLALSGQGQVQAPVPPVRRLSSTGLGLDWSSVSPALLELQLADVRDPTLSAWLDSGAPGTLERLELLDVELPLGTTQKLVDRQTALRVLHLEDDLPDDLARWLAKSPVLSKLEHLALGGPATDEGLDAMLVDFARFSRLKTIVLYGGRFGPTLRKWAYKQLPRLTFEARRPPADWTTRRR